jgi:hypothetical protein
MMWKIRLELTPDDNPPISYEIGTITRPIADLAPEQIGMTLEEGQQLLRQVQVQIISSQAHAYALCRRHCARCGSSKRIKDVRTKCVQTVFGAFRFRGRRYRSCQCLAQEDGYCQEFPLGEIIARRTTPEVRYLFAELGARLPYRAASEILNVCGFGNMRASHMAIRRHTLALGRALETQRLDAAGGQCAYPPETARSIVVGIDDTYIKHREPLVTRQFQVTAGRLERDGKLGARFVFVSSNPGWTDSFFDGFLLQQGMKKDTAMRVVTDGDDGLRNFVQRASPRPMESQLDWFHIGMKLELLRKCVVMPVSYQEYLNDPRAFDPIQRRVSRLRDALWRGKSWQALLQFAWLRADIDRWATQHPGRCADSVRRAKRVIKEVRYYVCGNRRSLPNFAKQRVAGHRISTAHVESVMNHLVNHRLSKRQQMRWSRSGAHNLLQVRAELLNGTLTDAYRATHPRFRKKSDFTATKH